MDVYPSAVRYTVVRIGATVDRPAVDAGLERGGLALVATPARPGTVLDRERAAATIVGALASLERHGPVRLPVVPAEPKVTEVQLAQAANEARTALSAPVTLTVGPTRFRLSRWRIAQMLDLPSGGATGVGVGGPAARTWLSSLAQSVNRPPRDATFRVVSGGIEVVPARPGRMLDVDAARAAVEKAILSPTSRAATVATSTSEPSRSTADAEAMGITGIVGSYTTTYGGTPGRLHNVPLVADLIDGALVAPGARFSFNETTGERNAAKGFEEAPVIINGELENGIGGGVCQVSTTVFNAAFEAGLPIDSAHEPRALHRALPARTRRHRQLPRHRPRLHQRHRRLASRANVRQCRLAHRELYGTPQHRRVETDTAPLTVERKVPLEADRRPDTMYKEARRSSSSEGGATAHDERHEAGLQSRTGRTLYDTTWHSYYQSASRPSSASGPGRGGSQSPKPAKPPDHGDADRRDGDGAGDSPPRGCLGPQATPRP